MSRIDSIDIEIIRQLGKLDAPMHQPHGVAIHDDRVCIVDYELCRIQVFDQAGALIRVWGQYGDDPGDLIRPWGVALGEDGTVYVADQGNNRVQAFTSQGDLIWSSGGLGTAPGQFDRPQGIAVWDGQIFVADTENARIQVLDLDGSVQAVFSGIVDRPVDLAVHQGELYVADAGSRMVRVVVKGKVAREWVVGSAPLPGSTSSDGPSGITVTAVGSVHVADTRSFQVIEYDRNGALIGAVGGPGTGKFQFDTPRCIASRAQHVYVADSGNRRVAQFEGQNWLTSFGGVSPEGHLRQPRHVAYHERSNSLYVVDRDNLRIQVFDLLTGQYSFGIASPSLHDPIGIAVAARSSSVLVTDNDPVGGAKVCVFDPQGNVSTFPIAQPGSPNAVPLSWPPFADGLAVDHRSGDIWVSEKANGFVMKYDAAGILQEMWPLPNATPSAGFANSPSDVVVAANGRRYVADPAGSRILIVEPAGRYRAYHDPSNVMQPSAIAVDESRGLVYAVNGNARGSVFIIDERSGDIVERRNQGGGAGELRGCGGISLAPEGGRLFVSEWENHRIQEFALDL